MENLPCSGLVNWLAKGHQEMRRRGPDALLPHIGRRGEPAGDKPVLERGTEHIYSYFSTFSSKIEPIRADHLALQTRAILE
jgi:hypothetical protein